MAIPTALLVKGGVGVVAVAAPVSAYFITDGINKKRLREENRKFNEKITALGIDEGCHFQDIKDKAECELEEAKVKVINFNNKTQSSDLTLSGLDASKKLNLVIEKGYATTDFPEGLRFNFTNSNNSEVKIGESNNEIKLLQNTSYDFKMKSDDKTKLEKAWTITTLGDKVGLTCTGDTATTCTIKSEGINVWKDKSNYVLEATAATGSSVAVAKDTSSHNGGFKFTVSSDTNLTQNTQNKKVGTVDKLTQTSTNNTSYEIDIKEVDGTKTWFLVEKATASSVPQESQ